MNNPFQHKANEGFSWIEIEVALGDGLQHTECVYLKYADKPVVRVPLSKEPDCMASGKYTLPFTVPTGATYSITPYNPDLLN